MGCGWAYQTVGDGSWLAWHSPQRDLPQPSPWRSHGTGFAQETVERGKPAEEIKAEHARQTYLGQWIDPSKVADIAVFLASPKARNISGQVIGVDGNTETLGV